MSIWLLSDHECHDADGVYGCSEQPRNCESERDREGVGGPEQPADDPDTDGSNLRETNRRETHQFDACGQHRIPLGEPELESPVGQPEVESQRGDGDEPQPTLYGIEMNDPLADAGRATLRRWT